MFAVNIDSITDQQLEFCGFRMVHAGPQYKLYEDYYGNDYIVSNRSPRWIMVDDLNDAECLKASVVMDIVE
jgi:hypothetical protein